LRKKEMRVESSNDEAMGVDQFAFLPELVRK
jgi:hypothetical protein